MVQEDVTNKGRFQNVRGNGMARLAWAVAVVLLGALPLQAADSSQAASLLARGKYAEAAEAFRAIGTGDASAVLGLARALGAVGRDSEALAVLADAVAAAPSVDLLVEMASLELMRGDREPAGAHVAQALQLDSASVRARWLDAELARLAGRLDEADAGYRSLVEFYNAHDVVRPDDLRAVGLAAARYAEWNRLGDQYQVIVDDIYPAALRRDPAYWQAHYEMGRLFQAKYNLEAASRHYQAALALNPCAAEVHAASVQLALEGHDVVAAEASLARALEINPRLLEARLVEADLHWANFEVRETLEILQQIALPLNPLAEETLGRIGACYFLLDEASLTKPSPRLEKLAAEVTARNPHPGEFYCTLAAWLEARNQMPEADHFLQAAMESMPRMLGPESLLAQLSMRTGREEAARAQLQAAAKADPFNVRVRNLLELSNLLASKYQTRETEHFLVRSLGDPDEVLAGFAADHLEAVQPRLEKLFGFVPPRKTPVEFFTSSGGMKGMNWFATRMSGLPYIGTVAASTGWIVGVVSPHDLGEDARFNWARVLTHEYVHVVTLQQTRFHCPHWYTEALAVWCEQVPRPSAWNALLARRLAQDRLFTLENLNFGFIRPSSCDDSTLAYCQAVLYADYMLTLGGETKLRALLEAYAANLETPEAIQRTFGMPLADFERGYRQYVETLVAGFSRMAPMSPRDFPELLAAHQKDPADTATAAELAYHYLVRGANREGLALARDVLAREPRQPLATYVVARLLAQGGKRDEAIALLEAVIDRERPQALALNLLAGLRLEAGDYPAAAGWYALGEQCQPGDTRWTKALARVWLLAKDDARLAETLERLAVAEPDDPSIRKKLIQLAQNRKDWPAVVRWARELLEIDASDAEAHALFAEGHSGCHNGDLAIEAYRFAVRLAPEEPRWRLALAKGLLEGGQPAEAKSLLESLVNEQQGHQEAAELLQSILSKAGQKGE